MAISLEVEVFAWDCERKLVVIWLNNRIGAVDSHCQIDGYMVDLPIPGQRLVGIDGAAPAELGVSCSAALTTTTDLQVMAPSQEFGRRPNSG